MDAPVTDIRLLLALLAPLLGAGLVMANGRRPNTREACSLVAAVVRGWGMETVVIHAQPTPLRPERALRKQAQAQWTFLTQS